MNNFIITLFFITIATIGNSQDGGDSWATVKSKGKGTINCIYYQSPGLIYKEGNQMKGVCVDILKDFEKYVLKKYNKQVNINFTKEVTVFTEFLSKTKNTANLFGVANTTITSDRAKFLDFSPHYISNPMVLLTNKNSATLNSLSQIKTVFNGYTAVIIKGATHMNYINHIKKNFYPGLKVVLMNNGSDVRKYILNNDKAFTVIDFTEFFGIVKQRIPIKRHNVKLGKTTEKLAFIMKKGSDWKPIWNEFLSDGYRNSIEYKKIISKNLGNSFGSLLN